MKGVYRSGTKWKATIYHPRTGNIYLGTYELVSNAHKARNTAQETLSTIGNKIGLKSLVLEAVNVWRKEINLKPLKVK